MLIRKKLVQFCCLRQNIVMFFKKVNSASGKHRTKFLLNQMRQTGIKQWRLEKYLEAKPVNQLGTPG